MPRAKILGYLATAISLILCGLFVYSIFVIENPAIRNSSEFQLSMLQAPTYYAIAIPIGLIALILVGTGFWIGFTILTIKVVPPMPEIVEKKDNSKIKAFFLCIITLTLAGFLVYGIIMKNFWALAVPAGLITLVVLGAMFWVGIAIITTRSSLPEK